MPTVGKAPLSADLEKRLDAIEALNDPGREISPLPGGLTNQNYRVTTRNASYVARVSSPQTELLSIDRQSEYENSKAAAAADVAPEVVGYLPGQGLLVIRWIEGHTLTDADIGRPEMLARIANACQRLHAGPRFTGTFDMFSLQRSYLQLVQHRGFRLPDRYMEFTPHVNRIWQSLNARPVATVPCHNDLLAANFIDDGTKLWLIDYEYAGNNDPCFELGNIWSEANLDEASLIQLVTDYFGGHHPVKIARARLQALMAKYGWMLWASIQDSTSEMDFDFWQWGLEKYDRAIADFTDPHFADWLDVASGST
ncbi:choline/ethanolamine kinase family protein [Nakamurella antarctica]|uniref:choline/ethanolamine kinase family protein n=1 Tax=Nakamurella antarctica TaxID=1902245 RepID=UPI0013DD8AA8|nr:choline/ethanolamine kinase family protein [Nakamurella antarctica]